MIEITSTEQIESLFKISDSEDINDINDFVKKNNQVYVKTKSNGELIYIYIYIYIYQFHRNI